MEKIIKLKNQFNSLNTLFEFLKKESTFECSKDYDIWDVRTDSNGQMEKCIVIKKSAMHAVKLFFTEGDSVKVNYIIPNKLMNAYFGKSQKMRQNILEIIAEKIKQTILAAPQQKAFEELEKVVQKAAA